MKASVGENQTDGTVTGGTRRTGARMFTAGDKVSLSRRQNHIGIVGNGLRPISPVEYEMIVDILPRVMDDPETESVRRDRPKRRGFNLSPDHPLSPRFQGSFGQSLERQIWAEPLCLRLKGMVSLLMRSASTWYV